MLPRQPLKRSHHTEITPSENGLAQPFRTLTVLSATAGASLVRSDRALTMIWHRRPYPTGSENTHILWSGLSLYSHTRAPAGANQKPTLGQLTFTVDPSSNTQGSLRRAKFPFMRFRSAWIFSNQDNLRSSPNPSVARSNFRCNFSFKGD